MEVPPTPKKEGILAWAITTSQSWRQILILDFQSSMMGVIFLLNSGVQKAANFT